MAGLILKLVLAPALVVASTAAGRRWGPAVTGMLVTLPVVAGPILFITDVDHGDRFASRAANGSLLGLVSLALFVVVFVRLSKRFRWRPTLLLSALACLACDLCIVTVNVPPWAGLFLSWTAFAAALRSVPHTRGQPHYTYTWPWWDLPARALTTVVLVLALTYAASGLGAHLTGVLTPFPIATSVVAAFVMAQHGHPPTAATLRGVLVGLFGFAAFCFLVAILLVPAGAAVAFGAGLVGALGAQFVCRRFA